MNNQMSSPDALSPTNSPQIRETNKTTSFQLDYSLFSFGFFLFIMYLQYNHSKGTCRYYIGILNLVINSFPIMFSLIA